MESLASKQSQIGKEIEKISYAFQRMSPEKKTVPYLEGILKQLSTLWQNFVINDNEINTIYIGDHRDHEYFKSNFFKTVKSGYDALKNELTELIAHVQGSKIEQSRGTVKVNESNVESRERTHDDNIPPLVRKQKQAMIVLENTLTTLSNDQPKQYYEVKLDTIKRYWMQIQETNNAIWETYSAVSDNVYNINQFMQLERRVQDAEIKIKQILDHQRGTTNQTQQLTVNNPSMKLPKLVLPRFDGNYLHWQQFYDLFVQMIHNQNMANSQKMWYLKMNLSGEAEKLIRHLPLSDSNYELAWNILKDRYENKRLLVTALLDKLIAQPKINFESASSLKTLHDTTKECLLSLQNMGLSVKEHWDPIIMHILIKKLDNNTHSLYEQTLTSPRDLQSVEKFLNFIEVRFQALEALGSRAHTNILNKEIQKTNKPAALISNNANKIQCWVCNGSHAIYYCEIFKKMSAAERQRKTKELNLCINCLKKGHTWKKCQSRACIKCGKKHNTLLHENSTKQDNQDKQNNNQHQSASSLTAQSSEQNESYVILATAIAETIDIDGNVVPCRILLDSGSQLNFISENLRKRLRLSKTDTKMDICGIGKSSLTIKGKLYMKLKSKHHDYATEIEVFEVKQITTHQPQEYINIKNWEIPEDIILADPEFNKPQPVDILLGAELYGEIMRNGQIKLNDGLPTLQKTTLGWIVLGKVNNVDYITPFCGVTNVELENQLQKFWEIEECPRKSIMSIADRRCEEFFECTTFRNTQGRFVVNLPILSNLEVLGNSKELAFKRLASIERRLATKPLLKEQYNEFLNEYLRLGHMQKVSPNQISKAHYFMPHHYVLKPSSSTTKLRVVFDASARTSSNLSLNDLMLKGPKLQDDIMAIILRFRTKRYVFSADINKMYRQILVAEEDRNMQLVMWRKRPSDPVDYYQLCTVTYGTKSAPYLAVRCLLKLAELEGSQYPLAAKAIKDFYVDDVLTGSNQLDEAINMQQQLKTMLEAGGFHLHKWCANHPKLVQDIPKEDLEIKMDFGEMDDEHIKTLGLVWHPITDVFSITTMLRMHQITTKRTVLADMSHIFDPLGLVNPVIVASKMFLQELWKRKLDWDEELPVELQSKWLQFRKELTKLNDIQIPRFMFSNELMRSVELHAFADASTKAYGAALYFRSRDELGRLTVRLLCSKSRVAPTKALTLPRLELCAALLAAQLVNYVRENIGMKLEDVFYWTDSQIVISWTQGDPSTLKTFVANRVATIQELTNNAKWNYINTKLNPADLLSRGMSPEQLKSSKLWFQGPEFLTQSKSKWPRESVPVVTLPDEEKTVKVSLVSTKADDLYPLHIINHGNSFKKLINITAYIIKGIKVLYRHFKKQANIHRTINTVSKASLSVKDIDLATIVIVKKVQAAAFKEELQALQKGDQVSKKSKLLTLAPFLDSQGIIRVGGRLENADLSYNARHPIVLPENSIVTKLLMEHTHKKHFHAGPQAILAIVRQQFWVLNGRNLARITANKCVSCAKARPRLCIQQMGNLPTNRVQRARPFVNCGIDFCGPVFTHFRIRGKRPQKTYIALFCCLATKAIHLEVVSDLSTEGFINALKRFISRRGRCENIYCDNGRNFVGAKNHLNEIHDMLSNEYAKNKITNACLDDKIQFHFIPPRSPHFGGLWEAGVKSTKQLLYRTMASASLTYEELCTAIAEIEAILNSRPLTQASSDPNDLMALTPGHFITGAPLTAIIEPHNNEKMSLSARWQLLNYIKNEFWKRWSQEYLTQLQERAKWANSYPNLKQGSLVTIKDDNLPPLKWALGRVIETIPGADGKVRVADVKTSTGIYRRAIHLLAPLPIDLDDEENTDEMVIQERDDNDDKGGDHSKDISVTRKRKSSSSPINLAKVFLLTALVFPIFSNTQALSNTYE